MDTDFVSDAGQRGVVAVARPEQVVEEVEVGGGALLFDAPSLRRRGHNEVGRLGQSTDDRN